jgi:hypothetical protein
MDRKENAQASRFQELLAQFRALLEKDLHILIENAAREDLLLELQHHREHLREMVTEQTAELEKNKEMLEVRLKFEHLVSELSANFVAAPLSRVDDVVAPALDQISRVFGGDGS